MTQPKNEAERILREVSHAKADQVVITTEFVTVRRKKPNNPTEKAVEVRDIRQIARDNYVTSRVSLVCGYPIAGCLLAHQSIEMYLKGIIWIHSKKATGHNLRQLVGIGARLGIGGLASMSKTKDQMTMLKQLCAVYDTLRFSEEAGYVIDHKNIVLLLDEVAFAFEKMYAHKLAEAEPPRLYVHEVLKERFLKLNDYFTEDSITNNPGGATNGGEDAPPRPTEVARKSLIVMSVRDRGILPANIRIGHVPKRVSKEEQTQATTPSETPRENTE